MAFPLSIYGKYGWEKVVTTAKKHKLGTRMELPDGRVFRYSIAGEAIGAGLVGMQKNHTSASHIKDLLVATAAAIGVTRVNITVAGAAFAANAFQDGYLYTNDATAEGYVYRIKGHLAIGTSSTGFLNLDEEDGIREEAFDTTTQLGVRENAYTDINIFDATDIDGRALGVVPVDVANNEYFWLQTWGPVSVLTAGTVVLGNAVVPCSNVANGTAVDGAVEAVPVVASHTASAQLAHLGAGSLVERIGIVESVAATSEYSLVHLSIGR